MTLTERLTEYISACFTGLWVVSHEHEDAVREIAEMCRDQDWRLATWNVDQGLRIAGGEMPAEAGGNDPLAAIRAINALASPDSSALLDVPLVAAAQNVVPVSQTARESVDRLRDWAAGRCLDAEAGGLYRGKRGATGKPGRKVQRPGPSVN